MKQGQINVQTENIFPIIKKFLYSDHEIFLREIVSNAVDATQKLKTLASMGKFTDELGDIAVEVILDKKKKTLTVKDRGLGMNAEEVDKYINEIAFSGATEFVKKFKTKTEAEANAIIGHFGLGFYSSFMVSEKVELKSKTYKKGGNTKGIIWTCDGSPNYTLDESDKTDRGTEVTMYIDEESKEFLEEHRILELLNKYCKFLPVPIKFGKKTVTEEVEGEKDEKGNPKTIQVEQDRIINNPNPAWTVKPSDLKEEDYNAFYKELYPMNFQDPLFNIHLNVDYPFNLTGILYFPKLKEKFEVQRDKIQLYCNQVFVTDSVEGIVPDFLTLLHGVIDSPDIPLNVSRSFLQSDGNVKKISSHITKKVAEKLEKLFKDDRNDFEAKWDDIKIFIEYGMLSDEKFNEKAQKFCLLKDTDGKYYTLSEYEDLIKVEQKDKDNKVIYLYATNVEEQYSYIQAAKERGYNVLLMDSALDSHFVNMMETKLSDASFKRVDADIIDKLIQKEDSLPSKLTEDDQNKIRPIIEGVVEKEKFMVMFENMSEKDQPIMITENEFMRRMKDMQKVGGGGGMSFMGGFPDSYNLVVNSNHPLIGKILIEENEDRQKDLASQVIDLAMLSKGLLKGEALNNFLRRSVDMIK